MDASPDHLQRGVSVSQLVQLLRDEAPVDRLRPALIAAHGALRIRGLRIEQQHGLIHINGESVDGADTCVELLPLLEALRLHRIELLEIPANIPPKELLQGMVLLAQGADEQPFEAKLRAAGVWSVRVTHADTAPPVPDDVSDSPLLNAPTTEALQAAIAQVVSNADSAADRGEVPALVRSLYQLALAEEKLRLAGGDVGDRLLLIGAAFDELASSTVLRLATQALPSTPVLRQQVLAVVKRAGDAGASALISHLMSATDLAERRAYYDAIVALRAGVDALVQYLHHPRWYIVRNAAALLGEMRVQEAESPLGKLLAHNEVRVRVAAVSALTRIGSPNAHNLLDVALRDPAPEVRTAALQGLLATASSTTSASTLAEALESERDGDMQLEILRALGKIGTADAVQRLMRLCSPTSGGNRNAVFRIAAAEALAGTRPNAAVPFLRLLLDDRDPQVQMRARVLMATM